MTSSRFSELTKGFDWLVHRALTHSIWVSAAKRKADPVDNDNSDEENLGESEDEEPKARCRQRNLGLHKRQASLHWAKAVLPCSVWQGFRLFMPLLHWPFLFWGLDQSKYSPVCANMPRVVVCVFVCVRACICGGEEGLSNRPLQ
jgi:hypothetical protein